MSLGKYIHNVKEGVLETVIQKTKSIYKNQNINTLENITKYLDENNFHITQICNNDDTECEYNIFFKILQIYKTHSINIKEPSILLINSLEKYSLFTFDEHDNNVIFFHNNFNKKKLNLDIIKKNYNELFLEYIKITSKYKSI